MTDGRNAPVFIIRPPRGDGVSCDYTHPKHRDGLPTRFEKYWRVLRDGVAIDSFRRKRNAVRALRRYMEKEGL